MTNIRVAIADDHPIVLAGLGMLIRAEADLQIVGEATSGPDALHLFRDESPDIAVIDISLPDMNGISLARQIAADRPDMGLIFLTQYEDRAYLTQALDAGARGYVLKKSAARCLVDAIRGVRSADSTLIRRWRHNCFYLPESRRLPKLRENLLLWPRGRLKYSSSWPRALLPRRSRSDSTSA